MRRRKWIITITVAISVALAVSLAAMQKSLYVATAAIALDARKIQAVPQDVVVSRLSQESPFLRTEIDVITSRTMAEGVAEHVDTALFPLSVREPAKSSSWRSALSSYFRSSQVQESSNNELDPEMQKRRIVDFLLSGLRVDNDGRSYTIFISFSAENPVLAAEIANAYADAYLDYLASIQKSATRDVSQWLANRLEELRSALETSERAVQAFRQSAELVEANGMTLQGNRLNALNIQLIQARSERAGAEARIDVARKYKAADKKVEAFGDVLKSPIVQNLRQQEAQVARTIQEIQNSGAMQSAQLSSMKIQQALLQRQIDEEIDRIIESLASEVEVMLRREKDIEDAIAETWQKTTQESKDLVKLQQLEREANANRTIYESFLNRYKQTIEQEGFVAPEARLISTAEIPSRASGRNLLAMLIFGLIGGSAAGTGLAYAVDRFDHRVRSGRRLEELTGLPIMGRIPALPRQNRIKPQDQIVTVPRSPYSEAIRRLAVALQRSRFMSKAKVIVVTSSERGEGKSTTCASLARALATSGRKVIVVDADFYRPRVAVSLGQDPDPNFSDFLSAEKSLHDIVRQDEKSGANFIAAGPIQESAEEILQGSVFKAFIRNLRDRYDFVIVDSPPICAAVDAALIGTYADAVLLVVRWGATTDTAVFTTLDELNILASPASGIILNQVEARSRSYEVGYTFSDHPISFPSLRQQSEVSEKVGTGSEKKLKNVNGPKLKRAQSERSPSSLI